MIQQGVGIAQEDAAALPGLGLAPRAEAVAPAPFEHLGQQLNDVAIAAVGHDLDALAAAAGGQRRIRRTLPIRQSLAEIAVTHSAETDLFDPHVVVDDRAAGGFAVQVHAQAFRFV